MGKRNRKISRRNKFFGTGPVGRWTLCDNEWLLVIDGSVLPMDRVIAIKRDGRRTEEVIERVMYRANGRCWCRAYSFSTLPEFAGEHMRSIMGEG